MSALDGGTFGLTEEFDRLIDRLFEIANQQGLALTVRIRRPRKARAFAKKRKRAA